MFAILAQTASTTVNDPPGWGAAEWIGLATVASLLVGTLVTAVVQVVRLRSETRVMRAENTQQHADNAKANAERNEELRADVRNLTKTVGKIDEKVDDLSEWAIVHETSHRRRWRR